jgi:hypothetical protein
MTSPVPAPVVIMHFNDLMERVQRLLEDVRNDINRVLQLANKALWLAVGAVADRIEDLSRQVQAAWERFLAANAELLAMPGNPALVWDTAAAWSERFSSPLGANLHEMNFEELAADHHWDGKAAEAYVTATENQRTPLGALQQIGLDIHSGLSDIAVGICALWAAVLAGLITALAALAGAIIGAATIVGVPVSLALVLTTIGALLLGLSTGIMGFMLVVERANDGMATLKARLDSKEGFGDTAWPGSRTERFTDGASWELA